jgi:hypothetical protein
MRAAISALGLALLILGGSAAQAAPTCLDRQGATVRCGGVGAMPVGWSPPAGVEAARPAQDGPDDGKLIGLTAFLAGIFALIALMPDFQGRWDRQADDDDERRG